MNLNALYQTAGALLAVVVGLGAAAGVWADQPGTAADTVTGETVDCVRARDVRSIQIVNDELLVVRGTLDRYWINRLSNRCAGMRKSMSLAIDRHGTRYCKNDGFAARDHGALGVQFAANCHFGAFEAVSAAQVALLQEGLAGR